MLRDMIPEYHLLINEFSSGCKSFDSATISDVTEWCKYFKDDM